MKKNNFFVPIILCIAFFSCTGFKEQPVFVSIFGDDIEPLKIISYKNNLKNEVEIAFGKNLRHIECSVFKEDKDGFEEESFTCKVEALEENDESVIFKIIPEEKFNVKIGEPFFVTGNIKDNMLNSLNFTLSFTGANTNPAELKISEVRPLYSSSPKSEFIELLVVKSGNLSGIKLLNVGDKKTPDYTFPAAEVKTGEFIVYHWRSVEEGLKDETTEKIISGGSQACLAARDFWGGFNKLPKRPCNVILVEFEGVLKDAVLFCSKEQDKWTSQELEHAAKRAVEEGLWGPNAEINNAVRYKITPSVSIGRKNINTTNPNTSAKWYLYSYRDVTMGSRNR